MLQSFALGKHHPSKWRRKVMLTLKYMPNRVHILFIFTATALPISSDFTSMSYFALIFH